MPHKSHKIKQLASQKDPGVLLRDPGVLLKDPGALLRDPGVLLKDPGVLLKGPGAGAEAAAVDGGDGDDDFFTLDTTGAGPAPGGL